MVSIADWHTLAAWIHYCSALVAAETYCNGLLVCLLILLLVPVRAACLFPLDVGPDATQLARQIWQFSVRNLLINGHGGN